MNGVEADYTASVSFPPMASDPRRKWSRYAKTAALVFSWICLGLYAEMLGPTLPTLMYQTESDYTRAGLALSIRSGGLLVGSLLGGWIADYFIQWRVLQITGSLLLAALTNIPIPWTRSFAALSAVLWVAGVSHGFLTTGGNPLLGSIWGPQAAGPYSIMHAGYGLGAAMTSVLVSSFYSPLNSTVDPNDHAVDAVSFLSNSTDSVIIDPLIPYTLTAVLLVICALCFLPFTGLHRGIMTYLSKESASKSQSSTLDIPTDPNKNRPTTRTHFFSRDVCTVLKDRVFTIFQSISYRTFLLFLCVFVMYFAIVGNERVFGKFMFTYAIYGPVHMTSSHGYLLNLLYWTFFGLARVLTCLLSLVIPSSITLSIVVFGTLFASVGLIIIPPTETWFFTFTCLFSLFKSPLFPVTLATINRSHEITGMIVLIINLGSACGAALLQYAAGALIDRYGQSTFPYLVCGSACVVLVTATLLLLTLRSIGDRFVKESPAQVLDQTNSVVLTDVQPIEEGKSRLSLDQNA